MKYQIIGKNIEVTDGIKEALLKKMSRMDKYFVIDDDVTCRAVVRTYKTGQKVEITIFTKMMDFRAEVVDDDLYAAFDLAIDKLEGQMRKLKTRLDRRNREGLGKSIAFENFDAEQEEEENDEVIRTKSYMLTPMSVDEAITRMEALGHNFFMYLDDEDQMISVLYRRADGGLGIIQAENSLK
ncbi:MAG: ribosome-associated translation inhibitor RaiA [Erysipelotrichaceae bacterium]|nr:ribosome-associated translation inhibitor RaiA [Erysipelotrichaceae bacterium]